MHKNSNHTIMKSTIVKSTTVLLALFTALQHNYAQEIERITMKPMNVVYITDTAETVESFSPKMEKGYGILFGFIGRQQLKPGKVMTIYHTMKAPWVFDIAVEVDKASAELTSEVQFKTIEGGDAIVVHYKGPYEKIEKAYLQIEEWLKKNNKQRSGPPMEVYLNDPATVKDKNELLTDVYQLVK